MLCGLIVMSRWTFALLLAPALVATMPASADSGSIDGGAYLFAVAGCGGCHTDEAHHGAALAGGTPIDTPFGTFFGPNISPDPTYGIGSWSDSDFVQALRQGLRPDGGHLFPAFPYTSFTLITDTDLLDLKAYIFAQPAVPQASKLHDLWFPFSWRWLQTFWRWMNFHAWAFQAGCLQEPGLEPRSLSHPGSRPLRGVPYPARYHRWSGDQPGLFGYDGRAGRPEGRRYHLG